ncbi:MAG: hypothetical protein IPK85_03370 [Gemmatimonadetes bacterium]|nr:hypothetical protein [Gemmatimonadota bacterium]
MKRVPIHRNQSLQRYSRLNPRSKSTHAKMRERRSIVAEVLKAHPFCHVCGIVKAVEVHEPWSRGRGGPILDRRNCMAVDERCHRFIHENPEWAEKHGFLIPGHEGPAWLERGGVNQ